MSIITLNDYFMVSIGRKEKYGHLLTPELISNAVEWVNRANILLVAAAKEGIKPAFDEVTKTHISSGWRPPEVNDRTANSGKKSTHMLCKGGDIEDQQDRSLARFCLRNLKLLEEIGFWMEDPRWTMTANKDPWVHLQIVPPGSGNRVFIPSASLPLAPPLPEQKI